MSSFLTETLGVASSGVMWDVGNFKLYQSTLPDTVLYITRVPQLLKDDKGRYQVAVSSYTQQQPDGGIKITGGAAQFAVTSAIQYDPKALQEAQASWRAAMGVSDTAKVKFVPLLTQKGEATLEIPALSGTPDKAHNDKDIGTPGGVSSFLVNLTEVGANEWVQGIRNKKGLPAMIKMTYEYLRLMPEVGAHVHADAKRVFQHLSAALDVSYNGICYGGSAKIEAAWQDMQRNGILQIDFYGTGLSPDLEKIRQELVATFVQQAQQQMFNLMFKPAPDIKPAQAGNSGGVFGGANFALKYTKETEAMAIDLDLKFHGWTWLRSSMDAPVGSMMANLDDSYISEVQTQVAADASLIVDSDPMLHNVGVSLSFSEGHSPVAAAYGTDGGNNRYTFYSHQPDQVKIKYTAKVDYAPPTWPIVQAQGEATVAQGGNIIPIKTSAWVGRHEIYMMVRDGDRILPPSELSEDDYLVLNVSYSGPHLKAPVKDSAHLSGLQMVEFSYPKDPLNRPGVAQFSAFGVIGGKLVRTPMQVLNPDETAALVLADKKGTLQLVSQNAPLPEDDKLAQTLLEAAARPIVTFNTGTAPTSETDKANKKTNGTGNALEVVGMVTAVEYGPNGPALWIKKTSGDKQRVQLRHVQEADPFDESSKYVKVNLDDTGTYADSILVELT